MLSIKHLIAILEISKTGSIRKAAQNLYTTQPYLSTVLREAEKEIDVTLFTRNHNGVVPTALGEQFIQYANQIVDLLNEIDNLKYKQPLQHLNIGSTPCLLIQETFSQFYAMHSNWNISFQENDYSQILQYLENNVIDIGIILVDSYREAQLNNLFTLMNLTFTPLYSDSLCTVVGKDNPLFEKDNILFSELSSYSYVPTRFGPYSQDFFKNTNINSAPFYFETGNMCFHYVSNTDCFTFGVPTLNMNNPLLLSKQIKFLKILDKSITITIGYLRRNDQTEKNVLVDAYIDFITTYFENLKADNPLKECEGTD